MLETASWIHGDSDNESQAREVPVGPLVLDDIESAFLLVLRYLLPHDQNDFES